MANIEKTFRHDTLGLINVVWKSNMRSVRMSFKDGRFTISAPVGYTMESIARLIQENESRMHSFIKRHEARRDDTRVDEHFILDTHFAIMRIALTDVATSRLKKSKTGDNPDKDEMVLEMPFNTDFDTPEAQQIVKEASIAVLRYEAKKRLPYIVKEIADANGFKYSSVKINSAQTRWGSCSSKGSLNFSLYTMLMPLHLIRSVVVHELCHTKFMDHGPNFWALFDKTFGVSHRIVDKEIRELKLPGFLRN
ncbi:MAG: M48 family metallopeptidase [Paludibacteraceae bacterium]|nr:M48 family metallopeptidase [Paludibacteraceae bacterium]